MFIQGTVTIKLDRSMYEDAKELTIPAMVSDKGLAYHLSPKMKNKEWYNLTHIATGYAILTDIHASKIETLAQKVEALTDWTSETINKAIYLQAIGILHNGS
jgi:hypothetical protein